MYMVAQGGNRVDGIHDVSSEIPRVRSRETHTADPPHFADGGKQFRERTLPCRIAIGIYILAQQLNFRVTEIRHLARFRENGIRRPATLFAAGERHDAERAKLVTAFNDGDVATVRVGTGGELGFKA